MNTVENAFVPVRGLHHFAWRCRDAEETRRFYEDLLGLPLVHVIAADKVPSTGELCPYVHIFFQMADGSYLAFFDLGDGVAAEPSPNTPAWVNHIALRVDSIAEVERAKQKLSNAGVEVLGVTDHGFVKSIYFFDPNGIRLELTCISTTPEQEAGYAKVAHERLSRWTNRHSGAVSAPVR